jgi:hypothetical protein
MAKSRVILAAGAQTHAGKIAYGINSQIPMILQ